MKICALTMVYQDYWALDQWYRHYGEQVGYSNLYIVVHGKDDRISDICPQASILTIPRDTLSHFDRLRADTLNALQVALLQSYDWVIRTDTDELLCSETGLEDTFAANQDVPVLTALGFDLVEVDGDPAMTDNVFETRKNIAFSGHYSKAVALNAPASLVLHGTRVPPRKIEKFAFRMPREFYLAHIKYSNLTVLADVNEVRQSVGNSSGTGLPGFGWKQANQDAAQFLETFNSKDVKSWTDASKHAHDTLSVKPSRNEKRGIVKTRALKFPYRTQLPDWFSKI